MKKQLRPFIGFLVLVMASLACGAPSPARGDEPSSPDQVATIVAGTLQVLTPEIPAGVTPEPGTPAGILPHSFYYLGTDNATGLTQVFRIERDGATIHQITFEPVNVDTYDVSLADGSVVYLTNNQLLWADMNGSGRRVLVDGGTPDPIDSFMNDLSKPVFSPDGQTVAYGLRGINTYIMSTGATAVILPQRPADIALGQWAEMYIPINYSPDGTKLLITIAIPNSDGISSGIFTPATNSLVRLSGEGGIFCCRQQGWTADGSALYAGSSSVGMFGSGLWRVDGATGTMTTLIPSEAGDGTFNLADEPYLAPDGRLYYFFAKAAAPDGFLTHAPIQLARSAIDGVTSREILRPNTFELMNEALWAPDASFVIVAMVMDTATYPGGRAEVTYIDGRPSVVLTPFAHQMKWGP